MNKFFATTAIALVSMSGAASAQESVLERVLNQISNDTNLASVNGTFANIAENIGGVDGSGVDGSITTTINGVTATVADATQSASADEDVFALEFNLPTLDIGNLSTTALGAVNTGDITLGVNSTVDEAQTSSTQAVSSVMSQLGGSSDTGALVLNIASNMTGVNGSITTVMSDVNGSLDSAATTALGAVNTGTITSGVNAAVQGITGTSGQGITGTSGQTDVASGDV
jgi:hypothetical protein